MRRSIGICSRLGAVAVALVAGACAHGTERKATPATGATATTIAALPSTTLPAASSVPSATTPPGASNDPQVVAAGDIGSCFSDDDERTAALVDGLPSATVLTLGDNVYEQGTAAEFASCYGPTWGRFKGRTKPAPGNHDYGTGKPDGYVGYFGVPDRYSFDVGSWHIISLNSNCRLVGGCGPGSAEERWLRADLAAHRAQCTLAYWHHPRWSSGTHGSDTSVDGLWRALADAKADVVLSGHDHDYERFSPIDGIREFVAGTGGRSHYPFVNALPSSEVRDGDTFGVLVLTLHPSSFEWRFAPVAGATFTDAGTSSCQ